MGRLAKSCNIGSSNKTVKAAINGLKEKGHIAILDEAKNNKAGTQYRVFLPCEIPGIESSTVVKFTVVDSTAVNSTVVNSADPTMVENTTVKNTTEASTVDTIGPNSTVVNSTVVDSTPFKERHSIKDILSPDPVKLFYTGIGQKRISKTKREKGNKVVQELEADGFSLEDIAYAAEWTPRNAKEKLYDMAILEHTIGEAISARSAEQQDADRQREEAARVSAAEEERRRLEGEIQEIRSGMTEGELAELRERAEKEIRESGEYQEQFITDMLITSKENEILRSKMGEYEN
jgi:DNA-binding transcriptional MerR regulator